MLFNDVHIEEKIHKCNLEEQQKYFDEQSRKESKSLPDKYKYLLSFKKDHCLYCVITRNIKKSSEALTSRSFVVKDYSQQELLECSTGQVYIENHEIDDVLDQHFIAYGTMNNSVNEATAVVEVMMKSIQETGDVPFKNYVQSIHSIQKVMNDLQKSSM